MGLELTSMILVSAFATGPLLSGRFSWLYPPACVAVGAAFGTIGIGLVGAVASFALWMGTQRPTKRRFVFGFFLSSAVLVAATFLFRSGWGRLLGITEAIWMADQTNFAGVGWGRWAWHQAEAQRAVLETLPFPIWKKIAPYFGVAPSLPLHLLAEIGWVGLTIWIVVLGLSAFGVLRTKLRAVRTFSGFVFAFLLTSIGTTPIQHLLTVDREEMSRCDEAIAEFRKSPSRDLSPLNVCPEIRTLEWIAAARETKESFLRWHETFPSDVMPAFVLGKIAAMSGNEPEALFWLEMAASGKPGTDSGARILKEEARRVVSGDRGRLKLWKSTSRDRDPTAW